MKKRQKLSWRYNNDVRFNSGAAFCALLSNFDYHNKNSIVSAVAIDVWPTAADNAGYSTQT